MSELTETFLIWLPLATIVPLVVARLTGSDWRGAVVEASIFAMMGLLIFPILIALIVASFNRDPNVQLIVAISYVLALGTSLLFRRRANRDPVRHSTRK